jgi:hypothetical protein
MSIEEKANAYDLALNKAKTLLSKCKRVSDKASMIYRAEDIENIFPEFQKPEEERIKDALIELVKCNERSGYTLLNNVSTSSMLAWLEKQGQSKKTSIWKHWKNGICGNGEGKLVFLIKSGATYSLSSCLSFECDYIELSELENLMLEKQDKQNSNIIWHDVSEEPEEHREIFCEWKGYADNVWHDVAFYHLDDKAFWNGERPISDVIKWAYIDDMLKEQP